MTSDIRPDERPHADREPVAELSAEERRIAKCIRERCRAERGQPGWRRLASPSTLFFIPVF